MSSQKLQALKSMSIIWMIVFFGSASALWLLMLVTYLFTGQMPETTVAQTWTQIALAIVGLPGYYGWLHFDQQLLSLATVKNK